MMIRILVIVILACVDCFASELIDYSELKQRADDYWRQIQQITSKEFGGWNLEVTVHTAYNFEESTNSGKGVGVGLSMPIYSKKDRIANRNAAREFSEHGSELVMKFKESIAHGEIISEECKYTKSIMTEYGVEAAKAFFDCKRRLASQMLIVEQKERDIKMVIDPFLKKSENIDVVKTGGQ